MHVSVFVMRVDPNVMVFHMFRRLHDAGAFFFGWYVKEGSSPCPEDVAGVGIECADVRGIIWITTDKNRNYKERRSFHEAFPVCCSGACAGRFLPVLRVR